MGWQTRDKLFSCCKDGDVLITILSRSVYTQKRAGFHLFRFSIHKLIFYYMKLVLHNPETIDSCRLPHLHARVSMLESPAEPHPVHIKPPQVSLHQRAPQRTTLRHLPPVMLTCLTKDKYSLITFMLIVDGWCCHYPKDNGDFWSSCLIILSLSSLRR